MKPRILAWLSLAALAAGEQPSCRDGWTENAGSCYYASCGTNLDFDAARAECQRIHPHADLVKIEHADEQKFVVDNMTVINGCRHNFDYKHYPYKYPSSLWIGARRFCPGTAMEWVADETALTKANTPTDAWHSQPSEDPNTCATFNFATAPNGKWVAAGCTDSASADGFVCEYLAQAGEGGARPAPKAKVSSSDERCDEGWCYFQDYCYRTFLGPGTSTDGAEWSEAEDLCRDESAHLTSVHSDAENNFTVQMANMVPSTKRQIWHGFNIVDSYDNTFAWSDGTPADYVHWYKDQPDHSNKFGVESCAEFFNKYASPVDFYKYWNDNRCDSKNPFVCKKPSLGFVPPVYTAATPTVGGCGNGYAAFNGRCFQLVSGQALSYEDAVKHCQITTNGKSPGHLASVRDVFDQMFLQSLAEPLSGAKGVKAWIGAYVADGSRVQWANEDRFLYSHWDETFRPGNGFAYMEGGSGLWGWTTDGSTPMDFFCTAPLSSDLSTPAPPSFPCQGSDLCFTLKLTESSWTKAEEFCSTNAQGGHLASITSLAQWAHVVAMAQQMYIGEFWIGLNDQGHQGDFVYSDGWPVALAPWAREQIPGRCVVMSLDESEKEFGAVLRTVPCSNYRPFLCESAKGPSPTQAVHGNCPIGWFSGSDACYRVNATAKLPYAEAFELCHANGPGGRLATFPRREDFDFFLQDGDLLRAQGQLFIGLEKTKDGWSYECTPAAFFSWAPGEPPEDVPHDGHFRPLCTVTDTVGLWYGQDCEVPHHFVCELPKAHYVTKPPTTALPSTTRAPPPVSKASTTTHSSYSPPPTVSAPNTTTNTTAKARGLTAAPLLALLLLVTAFARISSL